MAKQAHIPFLEEWLRSNSGGSSNIISKGSSSSSARAIIQAWSDLRDSLQHQSFSLLHHQSLKILLNSQASLYVADPQARLLLSILSSTNISLPPETYPLFLRLLYIWIRKSSKPSPVLVDLAIKFLSDLLSTQFDFSKNSFFFSEIVVLLGAFSLASSVSEKSKTLCLELLCGLLEEEYQLIGSSEQHVPNVLGGIGYALSSTGNVYFSRILDSLFEIWNREDGPCRTVSNGLMILHLIEWVLSSSINSNSLERVDVFTKEVLETSNPHHASFATVMAAAGALRVSSRFSSNALRRLRVSAEEKIETVAKGLIPDTGDLSKSGTDPEKSLLLKCISLALARSGSLSFRAPLLICLASALLTEIFPLEALYTRVLKLQPRNLSQLGINEVKEHLDSAPFKEAGAMTGVFCNQYVLADENSQNRVENLIWGYCQDAYLGHRQVALTLRGSNDELLGDLEQIAESAFLMVVVFALAVTKQKLDSKFSREMQMEISVEILVSLSCMEYFRRIRLPEYMDTIRSVVGTVQENQLACILFIESIPPYSELTNQPGSSSSQMTEHAWWKDEVQTSRILFYLRVIPTCIECLPVPVFRKVVALAPIMFLYIGHPNGKVARASHSVFVAFISSGKDSDEDERVLLKEQLVFYYIQRSLEGYPQITPFEGIVSGVAALVRHLPAGSSSIFYTIHSLVEKAHDLCREVMTQENDLWQNWQGELEPCKKFLDLLLRLLSIVDIQVLPSLMKQLAQLVAILPREGQNSVLNELYAQVADSDDVTRKPALVSWLQSLSYICSQANSSSTTSKRVERGEKSAFTRSDDTLCLDRINARL
ncbi:uncharacterized protein LOC131331860 isoform X1 [Rhododendron vialii]|uniref:uncharacterized protein LOC131331860 isoform X1 n=1 Tax=Rhododendron vialii TaxID=182163 RepID=UPI00265FC1CC|nr:uncharacterized protein LOC131331860 isoform X1 [Rhododendron vialii]